MGSSPWGHKRAGQDLELNNIPNSLESHFIHDEYGSLSIPCVEDFSLLHRKFIVIKTVKGVKI